jgi:hypothetical protein
MTRNRKFRIAVRSFGPFDRRSEQWEAFDRGKRAELEAEPFDLHPVRNPV